MSSSRPVDPPSDARRRAIDDMEVMLRMAEDLVANAEKQSDNIQTEVFREQAEILREGVERAERQLAAEQRRAAFRVITTE